MKVDIMKGCFSVIVQYQLLDGPQYINNGPITLQQMAHTLKLKGEEEGRVKHSLNDLIKDLVKMRQVTFPYGYE